jgi:hypothetical protein
MALEVWELNILANDSRSHVAGLVGGPRTGWGPQQWPQ